MIYEYNRLYRVTGISSVFITLTPSSSLMQVSSHELPFKLTRATAGHGPGHPRPAGGLDQPVKVAGTSESLEGITGILLSQAGDLSCTRILSGLHSVCCPGPGRQAGPGVYYIVRVYTRRPTWSLSVASNFSEHETCSATLRPGPG